MIKNFATEVSVRRGLTMLSNNIAFIFTFTPAKKGKRTALGVLQIFKGDVVYRAVTLQDIFWSK